MKNYGWRFVHYIGWDDQNYPQEKEMQKGKVVSEGALQIADKRREMKGKKERERYTHVNAVLQRLARRNKKAFFSEESKK